MPGSVLYTEITYEEDTMTNLDKKKKPEHYNFPRPEKDNLLKLCVPRKRPAWALFYAALVFACSISDYFEYLFFNHEVIVVKVSNFSFFLC